MELQHILVVRVQTVAKENARKETVWSYLTRHSFHKIWPQETQTQTSRHLEKLNRDGEKTQIPVALHLTNGSFIHGGAKHQAAIEQWSIGDEPFNTVRGDLARLGMELQENARQQIRIIRETEGPDATDIISDTDGAAVEGRIIVTTKAPC
ncbi:hypothetical protein FOQG_17926 [Fusarium oxysporum f. sp. raphani 54005]|uniref:Uncharacterized protein n=1 Tax=Fusarium oxysporum f. sp. raphani 54005 TaxID=1089458 RepID=X0C3L6_FUSOX|nr:hypothetical protein FOQG_17926 [Fusarium oxysporum f. sp. raphani 54005]